MFNLGTVFQTAAYFLFIIPRLRPGLLSLRSVLPSRQILQKRLSMKEQIRCIGAICDPL